MKLEFGTRGRFVEIQGGESQGRISIETRCDEDATFLQRHLIQACQELSVHEIGLACHHAWEQGYSMNGPTRTCTKCGKFERD